MNEIFRTLLASYGLSDASLDRFVNEFGEIMFLSLLSACQDRLNQETEERVLENLKNQDVDGAIKILANQYSSSEWQEMLDKQIAPVVTDYLEQVIYNRA